MNFAAEIVVRKNGSSYVAGFASQTGKGEKVSSYGKWFWSQMSFRPFRAAMEAARAEAARLNEGASTSAMTQPERDAIARAIK